MYQEQPTRKPITITTLAKMKRDREKFAVLTAYDASFAALLEAAGVEVILGLAIRWAWSSRASAPPYRSRWRNMIYHTRIVARGCRTALLMADMPFASYATVEQAVRYAARLMQEGGAHMVKLEGGGILVETVRQLGRNGIPVCAHLGLAAAVGPKLGGSRCRAARKPPPARLSTRRWRCRTGADVVLVECIPAELAARLTEALRIPLIGIGAGRAATPKC